MASGHRFSTQSSRSSASPSSWSARSVVTFRRGCWIVIAVQVALLSAAVGPGIFPVASAEQPVIVKAYPLGNETWLPSAALRLRRDVTNQNDNGDNIETATATTDNNERQPGPYVPPGGHEHECNPTARKCRDGMLLPAWRPVDNISAVDKAARAIVYMLVLCYLFLGVSIIADRFMSAIEVITSTEREVTIVRPNGELVVVSVRVWNETVSNLTLMALGSSAPEILLSIIEVVGNRFEAGDLGPGTIVGSAAFNLFVITALCVFVIPNGEVRRIKHLRVFFITATWSIFAYLWLYVIIALSSPNRVDVWEGLVTFLFFPATVITAYIADKKIFFNNFLSRRVKARISGTAGVVEGRENVELGISGSDGNGPTVNGVAGQELIGTSGTAGGQAADDKGLEDYEKTRREYIEILRELRRRKPDVDMATLESMAAAEVLNRGPKSRAFYRIQATRKMTGGGNIIKRKTAVVERNDDATDVTAGRDDDTMRVFFEPGQYTVFENVGAFTLTVVRQGGDVETTTAYVDYRTEDGTANAGSDYDFAQGTLIFQPGEVQRQFEIRVIDDDVFEEDEHFFVNLSNARLESATGAQVAGQKIQLVSPSMATVTILDDDHGGIFHFEQNETSFPESVGDAQIRVVRSSGARGRIALPYRTIDGTAVGNGHDYLDAVGELFFENDQTEGFIRVTVVNHDEYEKNVSFTVELGEPRAVNEDGEDVAPATPKPAVDSEGKELTEEERIAEMGKARLGDIVTITCSIRESTEFKSTVDKLLRKANMSLIVGTSSWREQFIDAITVSAGDDDDEGGGGEEEEGGEEGGKDTGEEEAKKVASLSDYIMHCLSFFWKILFAFVPPTDYLGGWAAFTVSILVIGLLTAVIGDVASHFGCTVGLQDSVTALSFVAMGTSIPDTFASKVAAINDEYADSSIGNVTGSNAVNVFLGIGIAWTIAAIYHAAKGTPGGFAVEAGTLGFSVTIFCACAFVCILVMLMRRAKVVGGELGGPAKFKYPTSILFFSLWIIYVLISSLESYCYIEGF